MNIINGFRKIAYKLSLIITLLLFCIVFLYALIDSKDMPLLNQIGGPSVIRILLLLSVAGFIFCIFRMYCRLLNHMSDTQKKVLTCLFFLVMITLQILFLVQMKVSLRYDALKVLDEAISVCKEGSVSPTRLDGYFARYTNNYPILFLTVFLLKAGNFLGILDCAYSQAMLYVGFINILFIDLGIYFLYRSIRLILNEKRGLQFLGLCFFFPVLYLWVPFYYTNTVSICFTSLLIYLFVKLYKMSAQTNRILQLLYYFLFGITFTIGFKIRATGFITFIAMILFLVLGMHKKENSKYIDNQNSKPTRTWLIRAVLLLSLLLGIMMSFVSYRFIERKYVPFDYTNTAFPTIHWISMGAGGTGEYSLQDELFTISQPTKADKTQANLLQYKERLQQLGISGYSKLMLSKLRLTFGNLTSGYSSELGVSTKYNDSNMYLLGCKSDLVGIISQAQYILFLIFAIIGILILLIHRDGPLWKNVSLSYILFLNLAGAMLFHMIWEAGSLYSLSFLLLYPAGMVFTLQEQHTIFSESVHNGLKKGEPWISLVTIVLILIPMIYLYPKTTKDVFTSNDAVVNQYIYEWGDTKELTNGTILKQTFLGNRPFNRISFQVRNMIGPANDAVYQVELTDEAGKKIDCFDLSADQLGDYDFARIELDEINPSNTKALYQLNLSKKSGSPQNNLVFLSYQTGNYDAYPYGTLTISGQSTSEDAIQQQSDLCFSVYETKNEPYLSKFAFILLFGFYIFCNLMIMWAFKKKK